MNDKTRNLDEDENESSAKVLERIRARLKEQVRLGFSAAPGPPQPASSDPGSIARLRVLLEQIQAAHREVGSVNPRRPNMVSSLIQAFKKTQLRLLKWYTRSLVRYHATSMEFLFQLTDILDHDHSQLQSLEAKVGLLAEELADLRQRTLAKGDANGQELERRVSRQS